MRQFLLLLTFISFQIVSLAQSYSLHVDTLISKVNIDTLTKYVNDLSGENEVTVNGVTTTIINRIDAQGNDLAADYIKQTLQKTGLAIDDQIYSTTGRNIIAYQSGDDYPEENYVICAHYDAIPNYGADDNASGIAAVLEAARILSNYDFPYTIVYALWDQEETGLFGSRYWAHEAQTNGMNIKGVINLDMIAYNTTQYNRFDIHTNPIAKSVDLAYYIYNISSLYNLTLSPVLFNPGSSSSDHRAFWDYDFSALMIIEPSTLNLFNPYYHTDEDRIDKFNMGFFHEMSKLTLGCIANLAGGDQFTAIDELNNSNQFFKLKVYPNPSSGNGFIELELLTGSQVKIEIYTINGMKVNTLVNKFLTPNTYQYEIHKLNLNSGLYVIKAYTEFGFISEKLIIIN